MSLQKSILSNRSSQPIVGHPQIGFQLTFNELTNVLVIRIIGARQLPTTFGSTKPEGYLVKVTVFPEKDKFETKMLSQSWPTFDQEFKTKPCSSGQLKGKFISLTAYAILIAEDIEESSQKNVLFRTLASLTIRKPVRKKSFRHSLNSRRIVGTITVDLEKHMFSLKLKNNILSTPEMWRELKEIWNSSRIENTEHQKGSLEINMSYILGENKKDNFVEIGVSKMRCKVQTMQEHEKLGGKLYIKIKAIEMGDTIQKIMSDKFDPTISLKLEQTSAKLKISIDEPNKEHLRILIRLICAPLLGKKIELGRIEIDHRTDIWREIMAAPMETVTKTIYFS